MPARCRCAPRGRWLDQNYAYCSSDIVFDNRGGDGAFTDPYRLYNADVFEYEADSEMSIYGSIPFMHAHKAGSTVALFDVVASETWVDITKLSKGTHTHWMSESGILDLFVFLGPTSEDIFSSYSLLTGTTALPQMFAIGHHQCRWNYLNQEDVAEVTRKFDEHDIPFDVIWLDIEYATEVSGDNVQGGACYAELFPTISTNTSSGTARTSQSPRRCKTRLLP